MANRKTGGIPRAAQGTDAPAVLLFADSRVPIRQDAFICEAELRGIVRHASVRGWRAVSVTVDSRKAAATIREAIRRTSPVGCIVRSGGRLNPPPSFFGGLPAVYIEPPGTLARRGVPHVVVDNDEVSRFAFRELLSGRPDSLAFIGGRWNRLWSQERGRAFAALAREARLPLFSFRYRREDNASRDARLHAFVRSLPARCGVFCATDLTAVDVSRFAAEEGRGVPRELSFVGVNDIHCEEAFPASSCTSVRLDFERVGHEAVQLLGDLVSGVPVPRRVPVGPLLVTRRDSTRGRRRTTTDIAKAVETIRAEACNGLGAAALAARFPGSRRLFDIRFQESMGHSVHDEILSVRLERVCHLLSRTDTAIGAIPFQCGFRSAIALQKLFLRRYGVSMREWRKKHGL